MKEEIHILRQPLLFADHRQVSHKISGENTGGDDKK